MIVLPAGGRLRRDGRHARNRRLRHRRMRHFLCRELGQPLSIPTLTRRLQAPRTRGAAVPRSSPPERVSTANPAARTAVALTTVTLSAKPKLQSTSRTTPKTIALRLQGAPCAVFWTRALGRDEAADTLRARQPEAPEGSELQLRAFVLSGRRLPSSPSTTHSANSTSDR